MKKAFTLAEVLITLAIIGVVAALTIPTLVVNYQKKVTVAKLKKQYNYINNAFKVYMANEGVDDMQDTTLWKLLPANGSIMSGVIGDDFANPNNAALKAELEKIFKISSISTVENQPVDYQVNVKRMNGQIDTPVVPGVVFLPDGTFLFLELYKNARRIADCNGSPCTSLKEFQEKNHTPTKLYKDLGYISIGPNGIKENIVIGRDFIEFQLGSDGYLYPSGGKEIAVLQGCDYAEDMTNCGFYWKKSSNNNDYWSCMDTSLVTGHGCTGRIMEEGWEMNY